MNSEFVNEVKTDKRESVLTGQFVRSGTGVGANIREAFYARGKTIAVAEAPLCRDPGGGDFFCCPG